VAQTKHHSWYGHRCHIVRDNGQVVRASILTLNVYQHHWGFKCTYFDANRKKKRSKLVSPTTLLTLQALWDRSEVISDEDSAESDKHILENDNVRQTWLTQCEISLLNTHLVLHPDPNFRILEPTVMSIQWSLNEVQLLSAILTNEK
jgi:hypothetical protein